MGAKFLIGALLKESFEPLAGTKLALLVALLEFVGAAGKQNGCASLLKEPSQFRGKSHDGLAFPEPP